MRTTVNIPSDALELARQRAKERDLTLGEAIGELERNGAAKEHIPSDFWKGVKFLPKRPGGSPVTVEQIQAIQEQLDYEDMMRAIDPNYGTEDESPE